MAKVYVTQAGGSGGSVATGVLQLSGGAAMSSTLTAVTDQNNTASPLKLSTNSVQVVSPLRVTTDDPSDMYLDLEDGSANNRFNITRNTASQQVNLNFASNPGGSTTVVGAIRTYVDGVNLSEIMTFREDGNIGIGTLTPGAKLDVHASTNVVAQFNRTGAGKSWIQFLQAGAGKWNVGYDNTNGNYTVYDVVNSTDRMVVSNTGMLGVGTNTPSATGHFKGSGTSGATTALLIQNNAGTEYFAVQDNGTVRIANAQAFRNGTSGGSNYFDMGNIIVRDGNAGPNGSISIGTGSAATARLQIQGSGSTSATTSLLVQNSAGTQVLKATDDGKLTIGTNSSNGGALLFQYPQVGTNGVFWGDDYSSIYGSITLSRGTGEMRIFAASGGYYQTFYEGGAERMRIQSGSVGIGTTSINASAVLQSDSTTQGFLPPRMTNAQRLAIATPAVGLMVYCTDAVEGLYVYKSTGWTFVI